MKMRILTLILAILMVTLPLSACGSKPSNAPADYTDREGNLITLPANAQKIASFGPSNTEILVALGLADKIVMADSYSEGITGLTADVVFVDMMLPDAEVILSVAPDIVFVTGMSKFSGTNPYQSVQDAGICVAFIPSGSTLESVIEDVQFIAKTAQLCGFDDSERVAAELTDKMASDIATVKAIAANIPDAEKRSVYIELQPTPDLYTTGSGTFYNEMLELIGAKNAFADQEGWIAVSEEQVLDIDPDVILTTTSFYTQDPVGDVKTRTGWENGSAVQGDRVYFLDPDLASRPSHNITRALIEIAAMVYPEHYNQ